MEQLKSIKHTLTGIVQSQLGDLKHTDAKELGEVIDMIKDLEEAMYYCSIVKAMEKVEENKENSTSISYYMDPRYPYYYTDRMYYDDGSNNGNSNSSNSRNYSPYMNWMRNYREGRTDASRRMYMETREVGDNDQKSMRELENYIAELSEDITDMIKQSTHEEKQVLSNRLQQLANKIK